ncbi:MAG TPA: hypothetical protein VIK56_06615 [Rhodoferax sp.]
MTIGIKFSKAERGQRTAGAAPALDPLEEGGSHIRIFSDVVI